MTIGQDKHKINVRIYLQHYEMPVRWVPYKTLIGFSRGNQVIINDRGEHLYHTQEFGAREGALAHANAEAQKTIDEKFCHISKQDIEWHVVEESSYY